MADRRQSRLNTITKCNRELASIYNELKYEDLDPAKARALIYNINTLIMGIEKGQLEKEVAELKAICKANGLL